MNTWKVVATIAVLVGIGTYIVSRDGVDNNVSNTNDDSVEYVSVTVDTKDWKTVSDTRWGFSFSYPENWDFAKYDSNGRSWYAVDPIAVQSQETIQTLDIAPGALLVAPEAYPCSDSDKNAFLGTSRIPAHFLRIEEKNNASNPTTNNTTDDTYQIDLKDGCLLVESILFNTDDPTANSEEYIELLRSIVASITVNKE